MEKQRIMITDDNEINRLLISSMLEDKYELVQASNGAEAIAMIQKFHGDIDLMLLDLVMPVMDGMQVLEEMNRRGWINDIPVIVISAETGTTLTRKAYDLGAEDYICRPFDPETVSRRIQKAIILHSDKKNLIDALTESFDLRERQNEIMINILSHIVEQRNGESGLHVIHINIITGLILQALNKMSGKYNIKEEDIPIICNASSFHDIGKMGIPEYILNKPGRLTPAEFEIIKTHSMLGYEMICKLDEYADELIVKYTKNICRYHHERWDGKGYPDGLIGDEIPIEAQVVALADVYDALTSERCYKSAYTHEKAVEMILNGECGAFNPDIMECLKTIEAKLKQVISSDSGAVLVSKDNSELLSAQNISRISATKGTDVSRNIRLLRNSEKRHDVFNRFTDEAWFEYYTKPEMIKLNPVAAKMFDVPEEISNPFQDENFLNKCGLQIRYAFDLDPKEHMEDKSFEMVVQFNDGKNYQLKGMVFISEPNSNNFEQYISGGIGRIVCLDK